MSEQENRDGIIEITDESGEKFEVEVIDMVTVDEQEYAVLLPLKSCHCEHDECDCEEDYVLMRVQKDGEEYSFETIEDDDEFEKVAAYIDELADEIND